MKNTELTDYERKQKNRLNKIHKLKRENVALGQKRKGLVHRMKTYPLESLNYYLENDAQLIYWYSEKIGRNSNKIQRLRTLIAQDKAKYES